MNAALIERWNGVVQPTDDIYVLGDFAFWYKDGAQPLDEIFHSLAGEKHLVVGNHDESNRKVFQLPWKTQTHLTQVRWGEDRFILCHFPLESWWHAHRGTLHLHGHCHGSLQRQIPHRFDVGTDVEHFVPVSAPELLLRAVAQEFTPQDHHAAD